MDRNSEEELDKKLIVDLQRGQLVVRTCIGNWRVEAGCRAIDWIGRSATMEPRCLPSVFIDGDVILGTTARGTRGEASRNKAYESETPDGLCCFDFVNWRARGVVFLRPIQTWPYQKSTREYRIRGPPLAWALGGCPCSPWVSAGPANKLRITRIRQVKK
jgi:hypothetical protein